MYKWTTSVCLKLTQHCKLTISSVQFSCSVVSLCNPMDYSTPGFSSIINSRSLLKLMSIELVMPSNHLILCCSLHCLPSIFPNFRVFPTSQFFASGGQSIEASASASVIPMNIQGWFPIRLTGLISSLSKGLSRVYSSTTAWERQFFSPWSFLWSNSHIHTWLLKKT